MKICYVERNFNADETCVADMNDRKIEVIGQFTVGNADFGLAFYSEYGDGAVLYYSPATGKLVLDMRQLVRWHNDDGAFNGLYSTSLPSPVAKGSTMKMHVFVDHSIMDIFINDMWATSVRLFPTANAAESVEVFSEGGTTPANVTAYRLDNASGIQEFAVSGNNGSEYIDVFNASGICVRRNADKGNAFSNLPPGLYIADGKKIMIK